MLGHNELLWFQKSRSVWLQNGDRNTSYFHTCILARQKRNKIDSLIVENDWSFDDEVPRRDVVQFFQTLYTRDYEVDGVVPCWGKFPFIDREVLRKLVSFVPDEEIR